MALGCSRHAAPQRALSSLLPDSPPGACVEIIKWQSGLRPRTLELSQLVACCSRHESLPSALMLTCPQLFTTTWTPAPGAPMPSSGLHRHHTHKHTHIYIVKKIFQKMFRSSLHFIFCLENRSFSSSRAQSDPISLTVVRHSLLSIYLFI